MNKIYFFDLRPRPLYENLCGKEIDLLTLVNTIEKTIIAKDGSLYLKKGDLNKPLICITKSKDWEKIIRTCLLIVSGKTIPDKTLSVYKELYRQIEKKYSRRLVFDSKFVIFFVSLIVSFRLHTLGWSEQSSNRISDVLSFVDNMFKNKDKLISISSIFCAHRESDAEDMNTLVKQVKEVSLKRFIYLLHSLSLNIDAKYTEIVWYHPIGGKHALVEVFPNIAIKHINEGNVNKLLAQMDMHFENVQKITKSLNTPKISIKLIPLDSFVLGVEQECRKIAGKNWRGITNFNSVKNTDIRSITQDMTLKDVSRYMPEYEKPVGIKVMDLSSLTDMGKEALDWYVEGGRLNLHSKSLYETVFYYHWGELTKKLGGVAIGIDRDHDLFQVQAFSLGYNNWIDISLGSPLLYARRTEDELKTNDVSSTSIRQFWRHSENYKK